MRIKCLCVPLCEGAYECVLVYAHGRRSGGETMKGNGETPSLFAHSRSSSPVHRM